MAEMVYPGSTVTSAISLGTLLGLLGACGGVLPDDARGVYPYLLDQVLDLLDQNLVVVGSLLIHRTNAFQQSVGNLLQIRIRDSRFGQNSHFCLEFAIFFFQSIHALEKGYVSCLQILQSRFQTTVALPRTPAVAGQPPVDWEHPAPEGGTQ